MDTNRRIPDAYSWRGVLLKDEKLICEIQSYNVPFSLQTSLIILKYDSASIFPLSALPTFELHPLGPNPARLFEWKRFLTYLLSSRKVAVVRVHGWELLINPPGISPIREKQSVVVSYRQKVSLQDDFYVPVQPASNPDFAIGFGDKFQGVGAGQSNSRRLNLIAQEQKKKADDGLRKYAQTHPSYLETLGQSHASWIFGAIAELVDNARDAGATRLDITIEQEYFKAVKNHIPVLCVTDNGAGMSHTDILRMISFGHKRPENDDSGLIGRFGVGFKTGSMRLGKDAVVFTQSRQTRSIAFLSRSFNEGKEEVEIPIVTYRKEGGWMELDCTVHSQDEAEGRLKAVKAHSPFNEYSIGSKFSVFGEGTGTTVCIYNLDRWGSDYSLQWDAKATMEAGHKIKRDITIRSRRVRTRPAQMTKEVPLDYSLHAYLEVMFLEPKMKIYVQGTLVKTSRLHKDLNKTRVFNDTLLGKKVELTLGRSQAERDRGNCGIFLYWHGRLIEAYKRVGGMVHTADMGRGVIGVVDVTDIMSLGNGNVAVLNNKQGFTDCEAYAVLDDWLGNMANKYWDENFDCLEVKAGSTEYTPDHSWVQCNKCLKWRILDKSFDSKDLPDEWFCYMPPFKGTCTMLEEEVEAGVLTVGAVRTTYRNLGSRSTQAKEEMELSTTGGNSSVSNKESSDASIESDDNINIKVTEQKSSTWKRLKRGPAQVSKVRQLVSKKARKSG